MNYDHEVSVLLIINLIEKKEDEIISCKSCEINAQLLSSSDLLNLIFKKDIDIQNLNLFMYIILEKHVKSLSKMMSSLTVLMKKFIVIISELFNSNFLQKVIVKIISM